MWFDSGGGDPLYPRRLMAGMPRLLAIVMLDLLAVAAALAWSQVGLAQIIVFPLLIGAPAIVPLTGLWMVEKLACEIEKGKKR